MQKLKKSLILIAVTILFSKIALAQSMPTGSDILSIYQTYYGWVDFFLAFILFSSLVRLFVEKKFGEDSPATKPLYLSLGLILSIALVTWEVQMGYYFFQIGPISLLILLILFLVIIYNIIHNKGEGKDNKINWSKLMIAIAFILLGLILIWPGMLAYFPLADPDTIIAIVLLIPALIAAWIIGKWLTGKVKGDKTKSGKIGDTTKPIGKPTIKQTPLPEEYEEPAKKLRINKIYVTVCNVSGKLPGPYCDKTRPKEFDEGNEPKEYCQKCKPDKIIIKDIYIRNNKSRFHPSNVRRQYQQGDVLLITAIIESRKKSIRDMKLLWEIKDSKTGNLYPVSGNGKGYFAGDLENTELDTNALPKLAPKEEKEIIVKLLVIDPEKGTAVAQEEKKCRIFASPAISQQTTQPSPAPPSQQPPPPATPTQPQQQTLDYEIRLSESTTGRAAKGYGNKIQFNQKSKIIAYPNIALQKAGNIYPYWYIIKLDDKTKKENQNIRAEIGIKKSLELDYNQLTDINNLQQMSIKKIDGVYNAYCAICTLQNKKYIWLKNSNGSYVIDFITIEVKSLPEKEKEKNPEIKITDISGSEYKNPKKPLKIGKTNSRLSATLKNPPPGKTPNYYWGEFEINENGKQISQPVVFQENNIQLLDYSAITSQLTNKKLYLIQCYLIDEKENIIKDSKGNDVFDSIVIKIEQ